MHIIDDAVNIEETADHQNALTVFPSPTKGNLNIQLPTTDTWIVRVFNSNGQLVSTEKINQSNFIQLNIQNLNTGLYTVQAMNSAGRVYSEMVVKE
jgi:LEA14-like dessication related protein